MTPRGIKAITPAVPLAQKREKPPVLCRLRLHRERYESRGENQFRWHIYRCVRCGRERRRAA